MDWKSRAAALGVACAIAGAASAAPATRLDARFERARPSQQARSVVQWVLQSRDAQGKPFLVVDKKAAQLYVFEGGGRLRASTPVLLGAAVGDSSAPGVGERAQAGVLPFEDRTTPAGRFLTHPGRNRDGESVVWIDYEAALAIHRLRPGRSHDIRAARLDASRPDERRVSLGCVVVPVGFYLGVVEPLLGQREGVVYVLPETQATRDVFSDL
jgi:hypothetical protein